MYKKFNPGLHLNKVVTIAEQACGHVLKRVYKLSAHRLQIFLVKYKEYLRSLQLCEDKGIRRKLLKRNAFANMCLRSLQLIGRPGFKKMHKTFVTVKKYLPIKSSAFYNCNCCIKCIGIVNGNFELWFSNVFQPVLGDFP